MRIINASITRGEQLGEVLDIDKGRITRAIFSLEEKGLISREVNEKNRRQKIVSLTEEGVKVYDTVCDIYEAWDDVCYKGFTEEERILNREFIKRISQNVLEYKKR